MDSSSLEELYTTHEENSEEIPASSPQNITENDENSEIKDEINEACQKPTFKNALQAKKRLQAFALQKQISISPNAKSKGIITNEKSPNVQSVSQELSFLGTKSKKENPLDKAKATIEEIELLKKSEFPSMIQVSNDEKKIRRSRSKSSEHDFVFRKRERKVRNYRRSDNARRSLSPMITTARDKHSNKSKQKYPRNWDEFTRDNWTLEKLMCKDSHFKSKTSNTPNDIFRHLLFDSPAESIKPYHFKNERGDEVKVPFKFLRYTSAKPKVAFNENIFKLNEPFLNRKQVLDRTSKDNKAVLEKFYSKTTKKFKTSEPLGQRNWYLKNWRDSDSKVQETSIGLSFLQNYSDDDEEEEQILVDPAELNKSIRDNLREKKSAEETKSSTSLIGTEDYELEKTEGNNTEHIPIEHEDKMKTEERKSPSPQRNRTKSESRNENIKVEESISWTPERKVLQLEEMWQESPEMKKEQIASEERNNKIKIDKDSVSENRIPSDDEWAETPERKPEKKKMKKSKSKDDIDYTSVVKKSKKKSKKLIRKKKQREKDKKARKREKLKAEKLKKEKKKQKEKEKEKKKAILKKLKKEFEQNLEDKRKNSRNVDLLEMPVKVKIEKEDDYKQVVQPVDDLRRFLNQKERNFREDLEMEDEMRNLKGDEVLELFSLKVKEEKIVDDRKKYNSLHEEEKNSRETFRDDEKSVDKDVPDLEVNRSEKTKSGRKSKKATEELGVEITPDTEEYQSNWESDDGISPIVKRGSKKSSRGWESDEEVFERAFSKKEPGNVPFAESPVLEMPLDIKTFPRRNFNRQEKKRSKNSSPEYLDMEKEIKLLAAERINLNKERMQLEMEKIRIHELERKKSMEEMEHIGIEDLSPIWRKKEENRANRHSKNDSIDSTSRDKRETEVATSKNNDRVDETASTSMNASKSSINASDPSSVLSIQSSPEITSTKSPNHTGLESAYQEFMRAVSGGTKESKDIVISSSEGEMVHLVEESNRSKVKYSKSQRDKKREKSVEIGEKKEGQKVRSTTDPKILQEILLPGEIPLPEIPVPVPAPVPSPKLDLSQNLPPVSGKSSMHPTLAQSSAVEPKDAQEPAENQQHSSENSTPKRPFSFSTLVISAKRPLLLERSNWKVDNDSDEELLPTKKRREDTKPGQEVPTEPVKDHSKETGIEDGKVVVEKREQKVEGKGREKTDREKKVEIDNRGEHERSVKRKHSRSQSPFDTIKEKRRREDDTRRREDDTRRREDDTRRRDDDSRRREEDTRRREEDTRRRDEDRRRDLVSRRSEELRRKEQGEVKRRDRNKRLASPRHRESSPRRRRYSSPVHRRPSPRFRSPSRRVESRKPERVSRRSPQRSSPLKGRRSYSPSRPSPAPRRRSPSPRDASHYSRMSKSPRCSPMEGLKRSVADSTISDDLLPQPYSMESSSSPLCSSTPAPSSRRLRLALSPKRPSLDERINQVLGIELQPQPQPVWKPTEPQVDSRQNVSYPGYHQHTTSERLSLSTPMTSSKVLQVGNIIQVVPSEDLCVPPPPQPVQAPVLQKIVQVGNMLQIVPSDMETVILPLPRPEPPMEVPAAEKSIVIDTVPERQSAEDVLAGRMAERVKKRQEKENRKKEKERKKKEKDKKRKMRLKVSTEEMIKRALELDGYIGVDNEDQNAVVPEVINDTPSLDPSKSILSTSTSRFLDSTLKTEKERKSVQFADGVRPGEGTSPSGGEELSSPPPQSDVLVKPKKYKRLSSLKKKKRKVKVKVVKKRPVPPPPPTGSDEEYENLPPPSPPPGSPPPHVFPPRSKVHTINNIPQHYLSSYGISTASQTPPIVPPQPRRNLAFQTPPTAMYRTPPLHVNVVGQHFSRLGPAPPINMNVPPPPTNMHRDQQPYGSF